MGIGYIVGRKIACRGVYGQGKAIDEIQQALNIVGIVRIDLDALQLSTGGERNPFDFKFVEGAGLEASQQVIEGGGFSIHHQVRIQSQCSEHSSILVACPQTDLDLTPVEAGVKIVNTTTQIDR
ncbi:hypothetical protein VI26_11705 [Chromobacterium sp. LK1]|nr:hypothetical protein VI26_11705 [Chromobacterium sp. LK1]